MVSGGPGWAFGSGCQWDASRLPFHLGNYKTKFYYPTAEKYQPSPQWIDLFVFVKDSKNKVRQVLTLFSPGAFSVNA